MAVYLWKNGNKTLVQDTFRASEMVESEGFYFEDTIKKVAKKATVSKKKTAED